MKLERRIEGTKVRGTGEEELRQDAQTRQESEQGLDDRYDSRHQRTMRMAALSEPDSLEDQLRGKSDGEILMRYEF